MKKRGLGQLVNLFEVGRIKNLHLHGELPGGEAVPLIFKHVHSSVSSGCWASLGAALAEGIWGLTSIPRFLSNKCWLVASNYNSLMYDYFAKQSIKYKEN